MHRGLRLGFQSGEAGSLSTARLVDAGPDGGPKVLPGE